MEIHTKNQIFGIRVMRKHYTLYEIKGTIGVNNIQIDEAKQVYSQNVGAKLYALTKFFNSASSRTDELWIEINIADLK